MIYMFIPWYIIVEYSNACIFIKIIIKQSDGLTMLAIHKDVIVTPRVLKFHEIYFFEIFHFYEN